MSEDSLEMWLRVAPMFTGISVIYRKISGSLVLFLFLHFVCRDETTSVSNMTNLASRNASAQRTVCYFLFLGQLLYGLK